MQERGGGDRCIKGGASIPAVHLAERRQIGKGAQTKVPEKVRRGAVLNGIPDGRKPTDSLDQTTTVQRGEDPGGINPPHSFHLDPCHGLLIGDDRERLQGRRREAGLSIESEEAADVGSKPGRRGELNGVMVPLDHPSSSGVSFQFGEGGGNLRWVRSGTSGEFLDGRGSRCDEQQGLHDRNEFKT